MGLPMRDVENLEVLAARGIQTRPVQDRVPRWSSRSMRRSQSEGAETETTFAANAGRTGAA